ncbi:hypothetical protein CROQUDRAFT_105524 [Cronartium quercuum f. sp. fusiforme G11]|uniref:Uncharacterized protein n=1 Tax=Cronartium quercuum f. sp. fusiforme G11 TaxID=708437 RepID=A0A9P6NR95_9BASI|nr:hypothetical protein CROQUDRAFT_105524 [Cronartium quercuum f. sp. fusiforme G11]
MDPLCTWLKVYGIRNTLGSGRDGTDGSGHGREYCETSVSSNLCGELLAVPQSCASGPGSEARCHNTGHEAGSCSHEPPQHKREVAIETGQSPAAPPEVSLQAGVKQIVAWTMGLRVTKSLVPVRKTLKFGSLFHDHGLEMMSENEDLDQLLDRISTEPGVLLAGERGSIDVCNIPVKRPIRCHHGRSTGPMDRVEQSLVTRCAGELDVEAVGSPGRENHPTSHRPSVAWPPCVQYVCGFDCGPTRLRLTHGKPQLDV